MPAEWWAVIRSWRGSERCITISANLPPRNISLRINRATILTTAATFAKCKDHHQSCNLRHETGQRDRAAKKNRRLYSPAPRHANPALFFAQGTGTGTGQAL